MREFTKQDLRTPFFAVLAVAILGVWYFGVKKAQSTHDVQEPAVVTEDLTDQPDILEGIVPLSDIRASLRADGVEGVVGIELGRFRGQAVYVVALQSGDTLLYDALSGLALLDGEALEEDPAEVITEVAGATTLDGEFIDLSQDDADEESDEDPAEDAPEDETEPDQEDEPADDTPTDEEAEEQDESELEDPVDEDPEEEDSTDEDPTDDSAEQEDPVDEDPASEAEEETDDAAPATGNSPDTDSSDEEDTTSSEEGNGRGRTSAPGQNRS